MSLGSPPSAPSGPHGSADAPSGTRYHFSPATHALLLLIFGGMALGFGLLTWQTIEEWRLAPPAPRALTVAAAQAIPASDHYAWVTLTDASPDCSRPVRTPTSSYRYGVALGPQGQRVILAQPPSEAALCPSSPQAAPTFTGRLEQRAAGDGLPAGVFWDDWPNEHREGPAWILWTDWSPTRGLGAVLAVLFFGCMSLFGAAIFVAAIGMAVADRRALRLPAGRPIGDVRFRLPLSTGASALQMFSLSFGGLQVFVFGWLFFLTLIPDWLGIVVGVLAALWILATLGLFLDGWKRRASDLWLAEQGCHIQGGPLHGVRHRWDDARPQGEDFCRVIHHTVGTSGDIPEDRCTLVIRGEVVAISQDAAEDRSLQSIADTLCGVAPPPGVTAKDAPLGERTGRLAVVLCPGCGVPVPPRPDCVCAHCGLQVAMPEAVAQQLVARAAHDRDRSDSERLLRRVLRQPSATRINALLTALLPPLLLSWPVAGAVFDEFYQSRHLFRPYHGVALAVAALCGNLALQFLLRSQVAARAAVRIIATHFAARPAPKPGHAPDCRVCGAPLSIDPGRLLVLCLYCGSENVTGLNLIPIAAAQAQQIGSLRDTLTARLRERRRWRLLSLAAFVLLGLCALSLWPVRQTLHQRQASPATTPRTAAQNQPPQ